jgi:hypothetical protein
MDGIGRGRGLYSVHTYYLHRYLLLYSVIETASVMEHAAMRISQTFPRVGGRTVLGEWSQYRMGASRGTISGFVASGMDLTVVARPPFVGRLGYIHSKLSGAGVPDGRLDPSPSPTARIPLNKHGTLYSIVHLIP